VSIWKKQPDLAALNSASDGRANGVLGIHITEIGDDFVRAELQVEPRTHQPYGLLHGGLSCVLAETLGSVGASLACDEGYAVVGVDINATHMNASAVAKSSERLVHSNSGAGCSSGPSKS
jgi:uncharacterized protein (TIGR00369 family)